MVFIFETFNRTKVECKSFRATLPNSWIRAFNRTKVECK